MLPEIFINQKNAELVNQPSVSFIPAGKVDQLGQDTAYVERQFKDGHKVVLLNPQSKPLIYINYEPESQPEGLRKRGADLAKILQKRRFSQVSIEAGNLTIHQLLAFTEGFLLASYRFTTYFAKDEMEKKTFTVRGVYLVHNEVNEVQIKKLLHNVNAVYWVRNQVNEPANILTTPEFVNRMIHLASESGVDFEVFDKTKIQTLGMGGLLAVNQGSIYDPALVIYHWKPQNAVNSKPIVLVGKGITYDTGGLSLKPTSSMDTMKNDMAGAAAVASAVALLAKNQVPVWVIGLMPVTDNRLQGSAIAPGDVIKMHNGLFVEVMNTDAEGRLILADAISYAQKYSPLLTIDMATLTGSAQMAIGQYASVCMGNASNSYFTQLLGAGDITHEKLVQFPFWDEYAESLKSDIADLKNIGGKEAGAITAGKFLEKFCLSPYIHIDIAGTAYLTAASGYNQKGASGVGVRLFSEFIENISIEPDKN